MNSRSMAIAISIRESRKYLKKRFKYRMNSNVRKRKANLSGN
jgi:hypothetical protein